MQTLGDPVMLCAEHGIPMWWDEEDQLYRCAESQRGCDVTAEGTETTDA